MIALLFALNLHATETCVYHLDGPIRLSAADVDVDRLRELAPMIEPVNVTLARAESRLSRAIVAIARTEAKLGPLDRLLARFKVPANATVRRALRQTLAHQRAEITRTIARDQASWLRISQLSALGRHPEVRGLLRAGGRAFNAKCDARECLSKLDAVLATIADVRDTEDWESNHAFDPRFAVTMEHELYRARQTIDHVNLIMDRLLRTAAELNLEIPLPSKPPTIEHHGPGVPLSHAAEDLAAQRTRVQHLDAQLNALRSKLEARVQAYLRAALELLDALE